MDNGNISGAVVTPLMTPRDNFQGRSLTRLGVGELLNLSFAASPITSAAELGGLRWFIASGDGVLTDTGGNDGRGLYTAPAVAGSVTFELKVTSGSNAGLVVTSYPIEIVEPSDAVMMQKPGSGINHLHGTWSCAFLGEIFLLPKDVSFINVLMGEGSATASAQGFLSHLNACSHLAGSMYTVGPGDIASGCKVNAVDQVETGSLDQPFSDGDFVWPIPWLFSVGSSAPKQFTIAEHHATSDASGRATISKKNAGPFSSLADDPSSSF